MAMMEVLAGPERRRRWSVEQKRAVVSAAFAPGAVVSAVARRAGICPGQIYRWRQELREAAGGFVEVALSDAPLVPAPVAPDAPRAVIEASFPDGSRLRLPSSVSPSLAAAVIGAMRR